MFAQEGPMAWALTVDGKVRMLHRTLEASKQAQAKWKEAYENVIHVPLYPNYKEAIK